MSDSTTTGIMNLLGDLPGNAGVAFKLGTDLYNILSGSSGDDAMSDLSQYVASTLGDIETKLNSITTSLDFLTDYAEWNTVQPALAAADSALNTLWQTAEMASFDASKPASWNPGAISINYDGEGSATDVNNLYADVLSVYNNKLTVPVATTSSLPGDSQKTLIDLYISILLDRYAHNTADAAKQTTSVLEMAYSYFGTLLAQQQRALTMYIYALKRANIAQDFSITAWANIRRWIEDDSGAGKTNFFRLQGQAAQGAVTNYAQNNFDAFCTVTAEAAHVVGAPLAHLVTLSDGVYVPAGQAIVTWRLAYNPDSNTVVAVLYSGVPDPITGLVSPPFTTTYVQTKDAQPNYYFDVTYSPTGDGVTFIQTNYCVMTDAWLVKGWGNDWVIADLPYGNVSTDVLTSIGFQNPPPTGATTYSYTTKNWVPGAGVMSTTTNVPVTVVALSIQAASSPVQKGKVSGGNNPMSLPDLTDALNNLDPAAYSTNSGGFQFQRSQYITCSAVGATFPNNPSPNLASSEPNFPPMYPMTGAGLGSVNPTAPSCMIVPRNIYTFHLNSFAVPDSSDTSGGADTDSGGKSGTT